MAVQANRKKDTTAESPAPAKVKETKPANITASDYSAIATNADKTGNPDGLKYAAAVNLARERLGETADYDERAFREAIDSEFSQMNPTVTGGEMRGENWLSQGIRGAGEGINDFNEWVGGGLDAVWDATAGNIGEAAGLGSKWKDLFDGEDLAIVPDIAEDLLLSAVPYVGPLLAAGKNAIQQSDDWYEALTGYDDLTGQALNAEERWAKGLDAGITTGLSAIPGVGAMKNAGKAAKAGEGVIGGGKKVQAAVAKADDAFAKVDEAYDVLVRAEKTNDVANIPRLTKEFDEAVGAYDVAADAIPGNVFRRAADQAKETGKAWKQGVVDSVKPKAGPPEPASLARQAARAVASPFRQASRTARAIGGRDLATGAGTRQSILRAGEEALKGLKKEAPKNPNKLAGAAKWIAGMPMANAAVGYGGTLAGTAAETGDFSEAFIDTNEMLAENPGMMLAMAMPLGTKRFATRLPGPRGIHPGYRPSNVPFRTSLASAASRAGGRQASEDVIEGYDADQAAEAIRKLAALQAQGG